MNNAEMIAKLKDPKQAQQLCLRTKEEQGVLHEAGTKNLLCLDFPSETWNAARNGKLSRWVSYILVHGFQPEPEYDRWEVYVSGCEVRIRHRGSDKVGMLLTSVLDLSDFAGLELEDGNVFYEVGIAATKIHEGHKVVATFRKE